MEIRIDDGHGARWNMPAYLGHHYVAQYYLFSRWLGLPTRLDENLLVKTLRAAQSSDGSWEAVHDATSPVGDLSATIIDYMALKAMGVRTDDGAMRRARAYVVANGGVTNANTLTKFVLATFGILGWKDVTPLGWNVPGSLAVEGQFAQWTGPHLRAMAYLRGRKVRKDLGPLYRLDELFVDGDAPAFDTSDLPDLSPTPYEYVQDFLGRGTMPDRGKPDNQFEAIDPRGLHSTRQQPGGSWGAYTESTLLTMVCLDDYRRFIEANPSSEFNGQPPGTVDRAIDRGAEFVASIYLSDAKDAIPYKGPTMDGHVWDTALVAIGLAEGGSSGGEVGPTLDYLAQQQVAGSGGFPFGRDFYYAPDTDDTAEVVMALLHGGSRYRTAIADAVAWIDRMQNADGGWGAFAKNNTGTPITRLLMQFASDSVAPFDPSTPDVTGHILEAMGKVGRSTRTSSPVRDAVAYLRRNQARDGTWDGRWGVNKLYGTPAVVVGLLSVGVDRNDPLVARPLAWLASQQNPDGGFGESMHSYENPRLPHDVSTPTQTAWALMAFMASGDYESLAVVHAVAYLVKEFRARGGWVDGSSVGTGHPGIVYMQYPSYATAFPMTALGRFATRGKP